MPPIFYFKICRIYKTAEKQQKNNNGRFYNTIARQKNNNKNVDSTKPIKDAMTEKIICRFYRIKNIISCRFYTVAEKY